MHSWTHCWSFRQNLAADVLLGNLLIASGDEFDEEGFYRNNQKFHFSAYYCVLLLSHTSCSEHVISE